MENVSNNVHTNTSTNVEMNLEAKYENTRTKLQLHFFLESNNFSKVAQR